MAGDVTYAAVAMLPRERPHAPSGTSHPGVDQVHLEPLELPPDPWMCWPTSGNNISSWTSPGALPVCTFTKQKLPINRDVFLHLTTGTGKSSEISLSVADRDLHLVVELGNTITYAELHVKPQPQGNSRAETSAPGCRHRCSAWFYVALVLAVLVLILLGVVAIQAKQLLKDRAGKSESLLLYGLNSTSSDISSERTVSAALLKQLMEDLCEDGQGTTCELCPPGWQLHRGRCYFFSEEARSWEDSQKNCLARKSQLLVIEDEIEMEFIDNKDKDTKYIWIGLDTKDMEKTWSSVEDHRVKEKSRTALKSIEADKNCAVYRRKNVIQADNCHTLKEWICKKNATLLVL